MRIAFLVAVVIACGLAAYILPAQLAAAPAGIPATAPATQPATPYQVSGPQKKNGVETYSITSDYLEKPGDLHVVLPDKLDKSKRYKVLYLLPACGANTRESIPEVKKLDLANKYDLICVEPDFARMPWYADSDQIPKYKYDSYIPDVIVPFIDKTYPTLAKPEGRLLVGYSKSGLGALTLLLRHPDVFGRSASHGRTEPQEPLLRHPDVFGRSASWDTPLTQDNRPEFFCTDAYFKANYQPNKLVKDKAAVFANKPARIALGGHGFRTTPIMDKQLSDLNIAHFCDETLGGNHAWNSGWLEPMVEVLLSDDMAKAQPQTGAHSSPTTRPK